MSKSSDKRAAEQKVVNETPVAPEESRVEEAPAVEKKSKKAKELKAELSTHGVAVYPAGTHPRDIRKAAEAK